MDEEFGSALLTGCVLLALDVGLYPARPAERFARRMPISLPQEASLAAPRLPPTNHPRVHPAYPGRPRGRAGHGPTTSRRRRPGPNRRLGWPNSTCASLEHEAPTQAGEGPVMGAASNPAPPAIPAIRAACPRRAPGPHLGRTQRTRQRTDTGRRYRTPDSGHLDAQTPALDTGHRTPDTGRWPRTWTG